MSWGAVSLDRWAGEAPLAREAIKDTFLSEATAGGLLLVDVARPRGTVRGRLGLLVDGAIERALEARGAPPPGPSALRDREGSLEDQIRRAEVSGATGIALWFSALEDIASTGSLDGADSGTLRWWLAARSERPVRLGFDPANLDLGIFLAPVTLGSVLTDAARQDDFPAESSEVMSEPAPEEPSRISPPEEALRASTSREPHADDSDPESKMAESARAMAHALGDSTETGWLRDALLELSTPPPRAIAVGTDANDEDSADPAIRELSIPLAPIAPKLDIHFAAEEPEDEPPPPPHARPELDAETRRHLETCARDLRAASGPKPLAVVERLFANAYVPLRAALDLGADLPALRDTANEWAKSFEKSYVEAFDALRVRTKRPTMVVDVPEIALRVSRLHGARATQLLLVDALRYDLGDRVNERVRALVGQRAACAERFLLWSALPTTTAVQLELIGRGASGLREFTGEVSEDLVVAKGRKASMIRRLKTGHREVLKLDVVEAHLAEPNGADPEGFDGIAEEVAQRIAAHFEGLQPRTLVMVFGDHGFALDGEGEGPRKARSGGGSPEEVLVPAFAWLVGAVH